MGDFDPRTLIDSARSYERLRRRTWLFSLGYVGPFLVFLALLFATGDPQNPILVFYFLLLIPATCACVLGSFLTAIELRNFPCPRCGKRFATSWKWTLSFHRCKHCGLDLGPAAIAPEKPPSATDPWE